MTSLNCSDLVLNLEPTDVTGSSVTTMTAAAWIVNTNSNTCMLLHWLALPALLTWYIDVDIWSTVLLLHLACEAAINLY